MNWDAESETPLVTIRRLVRCNMTRLAGSQSQATLSARSREVVTNGEIIIGPLGNLNSSKVSLGPVSERSELRLITIPFVSTSSIGAGASFYSSFGGPLPWIFNKISPERYYLAVTRYR